MIDELFSHFGGLFSNKQITGMSMGATCTPLLANFFSNVRRFSPFMSLLYTRFDMNNMAVVMPEANTTYPSLAPECTPIVEFIIECMTPILKPSAKFSVLCQEQIKGNLTYKVR